MKFKLLDFVVFRSSVAHRYEGRLHGVMLVVWLAQFRVMCFDGVNEHWVPIGDLVPAPPRLPGGD